MTANQHGLTRDIPEAVRREVRTRSKFGCVVCRSGFYQYEHISPEFKDATAHVPEGICCLCGSCHDAVTRGRMSKAKVKAAYERIQALDPWQVERPKGPLDFHTGMAYLEIAGIKYPPEVNTVLRYHGLNLITVRPGGIYQPGLISAVFTDEEGIETLRLEENAWIGSLAAWDIRTTGQQLSVRHKRGRLALQLRLDPPGRIIIERLDMRFDLAHVLVGRHGYAIGRYLRNDVLAWMYAVIEVRGGSAESACFEYMTVEELKRRDEALKDVGQSLVGANRNFVLSGSLGMAWTGAGMVIASLCRGSNLYGIAAGFHRLDNVRKMIRRSSAELMEFIGAKGLTSDEV